MNTVPDKTKLWKTYSILMGSMVAGSALILGGQYLWNNFQQEAARKEAIKTEKYHQYTQLMAQLSQQNSGATLASNKEKDILEAERYCQAVTDGKVSPQKDWEEVSKEVSNLKPSGNSNAATNPKYLEVVTKQHQLLSQIKIYCPDRYSDLPKAAKEKLASSSFVLAPQDLPSSSASASTVQSALSPNTTRFTEDEAVGLIRNWIQAKKSVFASPFDRQLAANLTTGTLYYDITKPGGSLDWLQSNNAYYQFGTQTVNPTGKFSATGNQATIEVKVTEDRTFYVNGKVDAAQTNSKTSVLRYVLQLENGTWKIADYK